MNDNANVVLSVNPSQPLFELVLKPLELSGIRGVAGVVKQSVMVVRLANNASSRGSLQSALAESGGMDLVQAASANAVALNKVPSFGQAQSEKVDTVFQKMPLCRVEARAHLSSELRVVEISVVSDASANFATQPRRVAGSSVRFAETNLCRSS